MNSPTGSEPCTQAFRNYWKAQEERKIPQSVMEIGADLSSIAVGVVGVVGLLSPFYMGIAAAGITALLASSYCWRAYSAVNSRPDPNRTYATLLCLAQLIMSTTITALLLTEIATPFTAGWVLLGYQIGFAGCCFLTCGGAFLEHRCCRLENDNDS